DTTRAREELGWVPRRSSRDCAREQIGGIADATALPSPALRRDRFRTEPRGVRPVHREASRAAASR
ncbi:MAG TPA: hypothetical protein VF330_15465, partial [Lentzea sp.]